MNGSSIKYQQLSKLYSLTRVWNSNVQTVASRCQWEMSSSICSTQARGTHVMDCPKTWCGLTLTVNLELSFRKLLMPQCHPQPLGACLTNQKQRSQWTSLSTRVVILTNCTKCSNGHKKWLRIKNWNHGCTCHSSPHIPLCLLNPQDTAELDHHCAPCQGRCCWKAGKNLSFCDLKMKTQAVMQHFVLNGETPVYQRRLWPTSVWPHPAHELWSFIFYEISIFYLS